MSHVHLSLLRGVCQTRAFGERADLSSLDRGMRLA